MAGPIACLLATACGEPTTLTAPSPVTTSAQEQPTANIAGTWDNGHGAIMTISQTGTSVTGIHLPSTIELGSTTAVTTGTVTGIVSGNSVALQFHETVTVLSRGETVNCRGGDSFTGQVSSDLLTGVLISGTTRYICERGRSLPTPQISGPMIFTRQ